MENKTLTVYERALLFLHQTRLEMHGIKAELKVIRRDGSEIRAQTENNQIAV